MVNEDILVKCTKLPENMAKLINDLKFRRCSINQLQNSLIEIHAEIESILKGLDDDTVQYKDQFTKYAKEIEKLIVESLTQGIDYIKTKTDANKELLMDCSSDESIKEEAIKELQQYLLNSELEGFSDICGMQDTLQQLRVMFILPVKQPQLYVNHNVYNTMLLYGPPGCGKTHLVYAFSKEINAKMYCVTAGNILSKYVGESEKALVQIFQNIRKLNTPTILFIDEFDAFCRTRTSSEQDHTRRLKTEFLNQLTNNVSESQLIIIAATNVPWEIDSAVMRRFQKHLFLGLPDDKQRSDLINFYLKDIELQNQPDIQNLWETLIEKTAGYSNSDLKELVRCAIYKPITELSLVRFWNHDNGKYIHAPETSLNIDKIGTVFDLPPGSAKARCLTVNDLITSVDEVPCTVTKTDMKLFLHYNK